MARIAPSSAALPHALVRHLVALEVFALGGCASIVDGNTQSLSVKTNAQDNTEVFGARCSSDNDKGTWFVTMPGAVTVHRSYQNLSFSCEVPRHPNSKRVVYSATNGMAFGNILIGGLIGARVDKATGAAYD